MAPVAGYEEQTDNSLEKYTKAVAVPFETVWDLVTDTDDGKVGWSILLDPTRCPDEFLPWLAQFVGAKPVIGESAVAYRQRIQDAWIWRRGTLQGIYNAAARVGFTNVSVIERYLGDAWAVRFLFIQSEWTQVKEDYVARFLPVGIVWSHDW